MKRLAPLPRDAFPELQDTLGTYKGLLGYVPNSVLIMQRKPKLARAFTALTAAEGSAERMEIDIMASRLRDEYRAAVEAVLQPPDPGKPEAPG